MNLEKDQGKFGMDVYCTIVNRNGNEYCTLFSALVSAVVLEFKKDFNVALILFDDFEREIILFHFFKILSHAQLAGDFRIVKSLICRHLANETLIFNF